MIQLIKRNNLALNSLIVWHMIADNELLQELEFEKKEKYLNPLT